MDSVFYAQNLKVFACALQNGCSEIIEKLKKRDYFRVLFLPCGFIKTKHHLEHFPSYIQEKQLKSFRKNKSERQLVRDFYLFGEQNNYCVGRTVQRETFEV